MDTDTSLIEYPTQFPLKVMGLTGPGFAQTVLNIVQKHAPDFDGSTMEMRTSKQGKYLSVTCTVNATSRPQLDALYKELCDHPLVVMAL